MKSRGVYENPGGSIIMYAHRELEYLCLDRATYHYKELIANKYAELVYDGMWFAPLMYALQAFVFLRFFIDFMNFTSFFNFFDEICSNCTKATSFLLVLHPHTPCIAKIS